MSACGAAQQREGMRRVGVLMGAAETAWSRGWFAAFSRRLDELAWRESYNLITQVQWWNDQPEQMRVWAGELIARSARAIGLEIPPTILLRADELIE